MDLAGALSGPLQTFDVISCVEQKLPSYDELPNRERVLLGLCFVFRKLIGGTRSHQFDRRLVREIDTLALSM